MRVTAETKSRTRKRLLRCARRLFEKNGFEQATTRDITRDAAIALGTLFNYFPNKEALALAIIAEALDPRGANSWSSSVAVSRWRNFCSPTWPSPFGTFDHVAVIWSRSLKAH
jgi:AcrR family transcriptional regulator